MLLSFLCSGGSGNRAIVTERSVSRGDSSLEGAVGVTKNYTYYWKLVGYVLIIPKENVPCR